MLEKISPANRLRGSIRLPGDKSISHRYALLAGISEGVSQIHQYSTGADCQSTLGCLEALGIDVRRENGTVSIEGRGLEGLREPLAQLDAGNSGSIIRMLGGILAAQKFTSRIGGDASLSGRPMDRIIKPLAQMGAEIEARDARFPPLVIHGRPLHPIRYETPVASAQVKTCVLLAGLYADGETTVVEKVKTRDHTELALEQFGAEVEVVGGEITVRGRPKLMARELEAPGDLSSCVFFLVAATMVPGSEIQIQGVGLNPSRTAVLDWMVASGAKIRVVNIAQVNGEIVGTLVVSSAETEGGVIEGAMTAALIDEIPAMAVLGAVSRQGLTVRDASELRTKETDRIATVASNLRRMGAEVEEFDDGFRVPGKQRLRAAALDSCGDHRIAMAFAVAAMVADGETAIEGAEAASVSFPEFYDILRQIAE